MTSFLTNFKNLTVHFALTEINIVYPSHHIPLFGESSQAWEWQFASWLGQDGALLLAANNEILARPGPPARTSPLLYLTNDSIPGQVYNGVSDWLYQGL